MEIYFNLLKYTVKQYQSDGGQYIICEVRKKMILVTEEEIVRQKFLQYLINDLHIPVSKIDVEYPLARLKKGQRGRIDILIWNSENKPFLIIECKASNIQLSNQDYKQTVNYAEKTDCGLFWLTNGWVLEMYRKNEKDNEFHQTEAKTFLYQVLEAELKKLENIIFEEPIRFSEEEVSLNNANETADDYYNNMRKPELYIEKIVDSDEICRFTLRLEDLLFFNFEEKINFNSKQLKFISDEKYRIARTTDPSGGKYTSKQRHFCFENNKSEIYIVSFSIYAFLSNYFYLNVGIDPMKSNITEFKLEKWVKIKNDIAEFWHDGTLTIVTAQKRELTLNAVQKTCPYLLKEGKVFLGKLDLSKPLSWESPDVIDFFSRMIDYNYIRMNLKMSFKQ